MNLSGIVVTVKQGQFQQGLNVLEELKNVDVYHTDEASRRIIVVQEAETVQQEVEGLKTIKKLPMVSYAEMVYHYIAEETEQISPSQNQLFSEELSEVNLDSTLAQLNR